MFCLFIPGQNAQIHFFFCNETPESGLLLSNCGYFLPKNIVARSRYLCCPRNNANFWVLKNGRRKKGLIASAFLFRTAVCTSDEPSVAGKCRSVTPSSSRSDACWEFRRAEGAKWRTRILRWMENLYNRSELRTSRPRWSNGTCRKVVRKTPSSSGWKGWVLVIVAAVCRDLLSLATGEREGDGGG